MRFFRKTDIEASRTLDTAMLADELEARRRKRRYAYPAWLCLGSHYLYLGRPAMQALFWLTAGGLLLWWLVDFFRIPALVDRQNRRTMDALLKGWRLQFDRSLESAPLRPPPPQQAAAAWMSPPAPSSPIAEPVWPSRPTAPEDFEAPSSADIPDIPAADALRTVRARGPVRTGSGAILIALPILIVGISLLSPRPVYPRGMVEPSYRTVRDVNVRAAPSIGSPILARLEDNVLVRGAVEEVEGRGPSRWLRVTRGTHAGRYVALQNLDRR